MIVGDIYHLVVEHSHITYSPCLSIRDINHIGWLAKHTKDIVILGLIFEVSAEMTLFRLCPGVLLDTYTEAGQESNQTKGPVKDTYIGHGAHDRVAAK